MQAELIQRLTKAFEAQRDPQRAAGMAAYMKGHFPFLGIPTPERRRLSKQVTAGLPVPREPQLASLVRRLWKLPEREYQYFACDYVIAASGATSPDFLGTWRWLVTHKSWWDTVDALAISGVGSLLRRHKALQREMDGWIRDDDFWVARTAILHQLKWKGETDERRLFGYCRRRAPETEFFLRKAIGWALREYSKTAPDAVRRFVRENQKTLSPLSRREALKWLDRG